MRGFGILILLLALSIAARAEDWTTSDGKVYKDVVVVAAEDDGVRIKYDGGVGKIPYFQLPDDLLKRFGRDAASMVAKRAADEKAAAEAAAKAQEQAAALKKEKEEAAAAQAQNGGAQANASTKNGKSSSSSSASSTSSNPTSSSSSSTSPHPAQQWINPNGGNAANPANANTAEGGESGSPTPPPPFNPAAAPTEDDPYPHSKFQYEEGLYLCCLDSYPVNVYPLSLDASATAPPPQPPGGTIFLRIKTEGRRAEAPDTVSGTFVSNGALKKLPDDHKVEFLVDGAFIQASPNPDENEVNPDRVVLSNQVTFVITPEQAKAIANGKNVNVSIGSYNFRLDDAGLAILRGYQTDVDRLPPPSTNLTRTYHRVLNRLPSIVTMISTTCEYIILSAFGIVVVASIAAFVMGLTRFIKM